MNGNPSSVLRKAKTSKQLIVGQINLHKLLSQSAIRKENIMSTTTFAITKPKSAGPWWEIILVMTISLGISLVVPSLKILGILIPVAYLILERPLRKRSWTEAGFNIKAFPRELVRNLGWVLLVGVGAQALSVFGTYFLLPVYSAHVLARLPFDTHTLSGAVIVTLLVSTLGEELIYRGLFQKNISAFLPVPAAIGLSTLVFALMHYAPGPFIIVFVDLALVAVDSVIYGIIFARSNNVFVAWTAHFLADLCGMAFLLMLVR
jgi:membrane protease YdiL (CAAX protease family)